VSALDELRAFGRACGNLDGFTQRAAQEAAPLVEAEARKTAAAGKDPFGTTWQPKKDGGRPMVHAADHVHVRAVESSIEISLDGPGDPWHNEGTKGRPIRQVIPYAEAPDAILDAVEQGATVAFDAIMKGGS
jgi:hypothetical protein